MAGEKLTAKELAKELRRSVWTVYRYLEKGEFPNHERVCKGYLIPKSDLEAALARWKDQGFLE